MVVPQIRITVSNSLQNLADDYQKQVRRITDDVLLDAADELQRNSPVGATGDLRRGWDVIPARRRIGQSFGSIVNRAENARFRIVGRGPGGFPEFKPIAEWVAVKIGGDARERRSTIYKIRRKIAEEGTERWRTNTNFLGINRDQPIEEAKIFQDAKDELIKRINAIELE